MYWDLRRNNVQPKHQGARVAPHRSATSQNSSQVTASMFRSPLVPPTTRRCGAVSKYAVQTEDCKIFYLNLLVKNTIAIRRSNGKGPHIRKAPSLPIFIQISA